MNNGKIFSRKKKKSLNEIFREIKIRREAGKYCFVRGGGINDFAII